MRVNVKPCLLVSLVIFFIGCTSPSKFYEELPVGKLEGQLNLQWRDHPVKAFVYIPSADAPFRYTTSTGDVITPGSLYTDGGSIPRIVTIDKHFVPWRFGPAYLIHDWIFELQHCGLNEDNKYNSDNAALIMAEVIKTQYVSSGTEPSVRELIAIWEIYGFTKSFSGMLWDSDNAECEVPPHMEIHVDNMDAVAENNIMGEDSVTADQAVVKAKQLDEMLPSDFVEEHRGNAADSKELNFQDEYEEKLRAKRSGQ